MMQIYYLHENCLSLLALSFQPLEFCNTVYWQEWDDQWAFFDVCLEFWIFAVYLLLSQFEAARSTEHYINDADVAQCCDCPLSGGATAAKADNVASGPHEYFAKIVGTAYKAVEPCLDKAFGVFLLCCAFLGIGYHLYYNAYGSNYCSGPNP